MKLIIGERRTGKTTRAIELANKTGAYLLVPTKDDAIRLQKLCNRMPISVQELVEEGMHGSFVKNIVIDNAEIILSMILKKFGVETIEAITITNRTKG